MTTRDIQSHVEELYGLQLSPTLVSNITERIITLAKEWQNRPLEAIYPIVFFDAIHYKVRKDLLGLWVGESEGANFWLSVITELRNRGVQDILCMH